MTKLLLNVALIRVGARSQTSTHTMAREQREVCIKGALIVTGCPSEQESKVGLGEMQPLLHRVTRASLITESPANLRIEVDDLRPSKPADISQKQDQGVG